MLVSRRVTPTSASSSSPDLNFILRFLSCRRDSSKRCRCGFDPWVGKILWSRHHLDSCLENSMDRGAQWATDHGVTKSQTQLSTHTHTMCHGPWFLTHSVPSNCVTLSLIFMQQPKCHCHQRTSRPPRIDSVQFSSDAQSCPTLCNPMNRSTAGLPVHHQLLEFIQTHIHWDSDAIQPSYPLSSPSPPAPNPSQHQGLYQWLNSWYEVTKVLEFQVQNQSFQWIFRTDFL